MRKKGESEFFHAMVKGKIQINVFRQRGSMAAAKRTVETEPPVRSAGTACRVVDHQEEERTGSGNRDDGSVNYTLAS